VEGKKRLTYLPVRVVHDDLSLVRLLHLFDLRNNADQGQPDDRLDIKRALHPVVDKRHEEGKRQSETQTKDKPKTQIQRDLRRNIFVLRRGRRFVHHTCALCFHRGDHRGVTHTTDQILQKLVVDHQFSGTLVVFHGGTVKRHGVHAGLHQRAPRLLVVAARILVFRFNGRRGVLNRAG